MNKSKAIVLTVSVAAAVAVAVAVAVIVLRHKRKGNMNGEKTAKGLVKYAQAQLGRPYWWGTSGQISNPVLLASLQRLYPSQYNQPMYADAPNQMGVKVHDCMGLIEGYFWSPDADTAAVYNSNGFTDTTADNLYAQATEKGDISTIPEVAGLAVHMGKHIGIYEGNGNVIEARGHKYGVVRTKLSERPWQHWLKIPQLKY